MFGVAESERLHARNRASTRSTRNRNRTGPIQGADFGPFRGECTRAANARSAATKRGKNSGSRAISPASASGDCCCGSVVPLRRARDGTRTRCVAPDELNDVHGLGSSVSAAVIERLSTPTPSTRSIAARVLGSNTAPRSARETVLRPTPAAAASSLCFSPQRTRSARSRWPFVVDGSIIEGHDGHRVPSLNRRVNSKRQLFGREPEFRPDGARDVSMVAAWAVAEHHFASKSEQPARDEVAGGLSLGQLTGQTVGSGSEGSFLRERRSLA